MSAATVLSGGADDRYPGQQVGLHEVSTSKMSRTERLNRVSRLFQLPMRELAKRFGTGGRMTEEELERAERQAGIEHRVNAVDYDAHFGGTGVSLQRPGDADVALDADSLLYAMKAFKRKLQQGIEAKKRQSNAELTGEFEGSTRAPQLVHSCDTAGPGLTYCDPMVAGQCPDAKDLVGTPYENIWSMVGVPPNNKVVQCVPKDLVPITTEGEKKEEDMERRMHKIMTVIGANAEGIQNLSKWRDTAPCDAIPPMAFSENGNMCGTLYWKNDKMARRCMDDKVAAKLLPEGSNEQKLAKESVEQEGYRTCYTNPKEQTRKINSHLHRVKLWRQKLHHAVENAMRVPDFVVLFNRMARMGDLSKKYKNIDGTAITWAQVNDYMTRDDITDVDDVKKKSETCDDAKKEMERIDQLLSGGGDCDEEQCEDRLLRVLKIMARMVDAESKLQLEFTRWTVSNAKQIDAISKDEECKKHVTDPNYCETIAEACDIKCHAGDSAAEVEENCIPTPGGGSVHTDNQDLTWTVDGFSDAGHMQGFRYIEDPEVLGMFSKYQRQAWQQCASDRNSTASKTKDLREAHQKRVEEIGKVMSRHFPKATSYLYSENFKEARELGSERKAVKHLQTSSLAKQVEDAVLKAMRKAGMADSGVAEKTSLSEFIAKDILEDSQGDPVTYVDIVPKNTDNQLISLQAKLLEAFYRANKDAGKPTAQNAKSAAESAAAADHTWRAAALSTLAGLVDEDEGEDEGERE
jgi:hypothetical protein